MWLKIIMMRAPGHIRDRLPLKRDSNVASVNIDI
jgi:hypothetical protein